MRVVCFGCVCLLRILQRMHALHYGDIFPNGIPKRPTVCSHNNICMAWKVIRHHLNHAGGRGGEVDLARIVLCKGFTYMKLRDARTLSPEALFERRKQAVLLFKQGMNRIAIAAVVGVHRTVVGEWIRAWKNGGEAALRAKPGGRPRGQGKSIPVPVIAQFWQLVPDSLPPDHGLEAALWSVRAMRDWLLRHTGKSVPVRTTTNYLHAWGIRPPAGPRGLGDSFQQWLRHAHRRSRAPVERRRPTWWIDHASITAPATEEPLLLLMAATSLGSVRFFPLRRPATAPMIHRFLDGLATEAGVPVSVVIPEPCLAAHPGWSILPDRDPALCACSVCPPY